MHGDARPAQAETHAESLGLLHKRRKNLSSSRTRSVNQLHALLRELLPGGVPTDLTALKAAAVVRGLRPGLRHRSSAKITGQGSRCRYQTLRRPAGRQRALRRKPKVDVSMWDRPSPGPLRDCGWMGEFSDGSPRNDHGDSSPYWLLGPRDDATCASVCGAGSAGFGV
ncbi:hypothetical protein [Nocardia sp. NPDC052112]|uniref:hypothetical protein n=1 Tax=Nocardia sp. NPDC052112 TaxID=3155646 RepID=UPI0034180B9E